MKKTLLAAALMASSLCVQAELIQHTDQIAEVKFTGSTYDLGKHVGDVASKQITRSIHRFDTTLGVMLPGLTLESLSKNFKNAGVFAKLQKHSPDAAAYIKGLSESMELSPDYLLAVGMSDEAILESQRNGGIGFLQSEQPAKCTVMGQTNGEGLAWGAANFDYMAINYEGLIVLNHTDADGKTRIIQTWAGLIPYGGVTKGGQPLLMNTMADEGTARQNDNGDILGDTSVPSYHLSWEAYNVKSAEELSNIYKHGEYTAYFSYVLLDADARATNVENGYPAEMRTRHKQKFAHANHSLYKKYDFVNTEFAAHSLERQKAATSFMASASIATTEKQAIETLHREPLWKGRGDLMGTVTSTFYSVNGKKVDMAIYTDERHEPVRIKNY